jgi:hypothetical protein
MNLTSRRPACRPGRSPANSSALVSLGSHVERFDLLGSFTTKHKPPMARPEKYLAAWCRG